MPHRSLAVQLTAHANPYAERLIGSIRRECLDHVIVLGEHHLRRILTSYGVYYHGARTHLALAKDAPKSRRSRTLRKVASSRSRKSAGCIIATSDAPPDIPSSTSLTHGSRSYARSPAPTRTSWLT